MEETYKEKVARLKEADKKEASDAFHTLIHLLNTGAWEQVADAVRDVLNHEHRTLIQLFTRFVVWPSVTTIADMGSDLRNEASVSYCNDMKNAVGDDPYFPYV